MYRRYISPQKSSGWKPSFVAIITMLGLFFSESNYAADDPAGRAHFTITATIVAKTCSISADSKARTVDMGNISSKTFLLSKFSPPVNFSINLANCTSATKGLTVTFSGVKDSNDDSLLALSKEGGSAKNIGLAILDWQSKQRIPIGKPSTFYPVGEKDKNGISLKFYSQYVATGGPITPGTANADATFTIEYQ